MKLTIMTKEDVVYELRNRYSYFLRDAAKWVQSKNPGVDYETCEMHAIDMIYERCVSGFNNYDYIDTPQKAVEHARTSALGKQISEYADSLKSAAEAEQRREENEKKRKAAEKNFIKYCKSNGLNVEEEKTRRREKRRKKCRTSAIILFVICIITILAMLGLEFYVSTKEYKPQDYSASTSSKISLDSSISDDFNDLSNSTKALFEMLIYMFKAYRILWIVPLIFLIISIRKFVKSSKKHLAEFDYLNKEDFNN